MKTFPHLALFLLISSSAFTAPSALRGKPLSFHSELRGAGSDGYRRPTDPAGVYYTITDRGPNIDCDDALDLLGKELCSAENGKVYLEPEFNPTIYKWSWNGEGNPKLLEKIPLRDSNGRPVTGIANDHFNPEHPFGPSGESLSFDPSGIDPEGLVVLEDGSFFVSEEYGPSILRVDARGRIQERWIPQGSEEYYRNAAYPVVANLPEIFGQRRSNRGFESLAFDGKQLWLSNQSPLASPDEKTARKSRIVRLTAISLDGEVTAVYAYRFDEAGTFEEDAKNGDLKVSAMLFRGQDLLIQERTDKIMKIFRVSLEGAENILHGAWMRKDKRPSLEGAKKDLPTLVGKELLWSSRGTALPPKIESLISWGDSLLLLNDDDFGVTGESSQGFVIDMP